MRAARGIYATFAALVAGGGGLYLRGLGPSARGATGAVAVSTAAASSLAPAPAEALPEVALPAGAAERLTKIELTRPDDDDPSRMRTITLEKQGAGWSLTSPLRTKASASKVAALIDNLAHLHLWTVVDAGTGFYNRYGLTETQAQHVVAWAGSNKVSELYCGKSSAQGQLARVPGKDGVFALINWGPQGYAGFLYTRDARSWRDASLLSFEERDAVQIQITNRNGVFQFSRRADDPSPDRWTGSFSRRRANGRLGEPQRDWKAFDAGKVRELLAAYESLQADDFGEEGERAASGVDQAELTGGVVRIKLESHRSDLVIRVGKLSTNTSRWAIKDSRWAIEEGGDGSLYALSPWTAGWATAGAARFEARRAEPAPGPARMD